MRSFIIALSSVVSLSALTIAVVFAGYSGDVTLTGNYVENGHYSTWVGSRAFDDNASTQWRSAETGTGVNGVSWVGQDFGGSPKHVRRISYQQSSTSSEDVTSIKLQASSDCSTWLNVDQFAPATDNSVQTFDVVESGSYRCWRVLANSGAGVGQYWAVYEIQMMTYTADTPTATSLPATLTPTVTPTPYIARMEDVPGLMEALPAVRQLLSLFVLFALVGVFWRWFRR